MISLTIDITRVHFFSDVFATVASSDLKVPTIFTSPTGDEIAILRGHPRNAKVKPFAKQRQYLYFSVILRFRVLDRALDLLHYSHALYRLN